MATDINIDIKMTRPTQIDYQLNRLSAIDAQLREKVQELSVKLTPVLGLSVVKDGPECLSKSSESLVPLAVELNKYSNGLQDSIDILQSIMDRIEL